MSQMQSVPVAQQIQQLTAQLSQALAEKDQLEERKRTVTENIRAIRNVLAGVQLGQQLQKDIIAEQAAAASVPGVPAPHVHQ